MKRSLLETGMSPLQKVAVYAALLVGAAAFLYPFVWMVAATFKPELEIGGLDIVPTRWTTESYSLVFTSIPIGRAFLNSLLVVASVTASVLVFGSMAGYALAKLEWRGREAAFGLILFTMMVPFLVMLIPLYTIIVKMRLTDSLLGLIVPGMMSATAVLILRQSFLTVPSEILDAARIDGCGEWRILFTIMWPLSVPSLVTAGVITFIGNWNEVLWPLIVIRREEWMTMPQVVTLFAVGGGANAKLGPQLAAAVLLGLPVVIAYVFFQRRFISSLASTGLKG